MVIQRGITSPSRTQGFCLMVPSATIATTLPVGNSVLHEADESVLGATIRHTISNTAMAIQIVTKRVPNSRLLSTVRRSTPRPR